MTPADVLDLIIARWQPRMPRDILTFERTDYLARYRSAMLTELRPVIARLGLEPTRSIGGRHEVPLAPLLVEWKPRSSRTRFNAPAYPTLPRRNVDKVFHHIGDLDMLKLAASVRWEGQPPNAAARERLRRMQLAEQAGYKRKKLKFAGFNQLGYVFERDGKALTPAGMEALASGVYDRSETPAAGDDERDFAARRLADAKVLARWMATLPLSTLESASAFAAKLNHSPMGQHFAVRRDREGAKAPYLTDAGGAKREGWRFYGPKDDATYHGLLRKLIHYAAGNLEEHWADQGRTADQAARESKAAGKSLHDVLMDAGFIERASTDTVYLPAADRTTLEATIIENPTLYARFDEQRLLEGGYTLVELRDVVAAWVAEDSDADPFGTAAPARHRTTKDER